LANLLLLSTNWNIVSIKTFKTQVFLRYFMIKGEKDNFELSSETTKELEENRQIENLKKVEAALFISARFLNLQNLVMLTDINPLMVKELLNQLIEKYNRDDSAIEIIIKDNMWKMDVRQEYVSMINKLATGNSEFTKSEQETLAVIAYKQPAKQSVIIKIRGNKAYDHIKKFMDVGLVVGKRQGHTLDLNLSEDFFDYFHLQNKNGVMVLDDHSDSEGYEESEGLQKKESGEIVEESEEDGDELNSGAS